MPFWGPLLESDQVKVGERKEDCLTLEVPAGGLNFTLPMLIGESGFTSKLALQFSEDEKEVVRADTSLGFYRPLLEAGKEVSVKLDIHTPLLWSEKLVYGCHAHLAGCTVHHTKLHVAWLQALIATFAGETLASAPKDFIPVVYDISVQLTDHNILWPTNRFNMMVNMANNARSPKKSAGRKKPSEEEPNTNGLKQPVEDRQRNNTFLNFCGQSANIHFALDYSSYVEEMRKVVYTISSPMLRAQLLLPDSNTVMQNVVQLPLKAFWDFEGLDLRIGTVFHTVQDDPDLLDKCLTDIKVDGVKGPLLGYYVPRLVQW